MKLSNSSIRKSAYGELRRKGITIGSLDLLIAGIAIDNNMVLITNNTKHYSVITGLRISNWKT
jgi:predicted nucleic acid-binding protein